jgi:hypothetical protein
LGTLGEDVEVSETGLNYMTMVETWRNIILCISFLLAALSTGECGLLVGVE